MAATVRAPPSLPCGVAGKSASPDHRSKPLSTHFNPPRPGEELGGGVTGHGSEVEVTAGGGGWGATLLLQRDQYQEPVCSSTLSTLCRPA